MPLNPGTLRPKWLRQHKVQTNKDKGFYRTYRWKKFSKEYKIRNPLCIECKKSGIVTPSDITDHIIPIEMRGARYDERNLQPLCHKHHNIKRARERHGRIQPSVMGTSGRIPKNHINK